MKGLKSNKTKSIFAAIGILLVFLICSTVTGAVGGAIGGFFANIKGLEVQEYVIGLIPKLTLIAEIISIIVFGIWYYLGYVKKDKKEGKYESGLDKMKDVKTIIFLLLLTAGTHFFVCLVGDLVRYLIPGSQEILSQVMGLAIGDHDIAGYLAAMLFAPVAEELAFRGVMLKRLRGSFGLIGCAVVSSLMFGIMHLNPMQSIYVLPMGMMFAYVAYKYDSVIPAIIAHILNNCLGIILPTLTGRNTRSLESALLFALFIILAIFTGRKMPIFKSMKAVNEKA